MAGDVAAWEQLYARCQPALLGDIHRLLGQARPNLELVDELAARVWYALIDNDGRLLARYDPRRMARLGTFLRAVAHDQVRRHFRAERRRREHECEAMQQRAGPASGRSDHATLMLDEFRATLTPNQREYLDECLRASDLDGDDEPAGNESAGNAARLWKVASRVRRRLRAFLGME